MLPEASTLLLLMKRHIDQLMVDGHTANPKLQAVLAWVKQKTVSVDASYKPAAIRALYYRVELARALDIPHFLSIDISQFLAPVHILDFNLVIDLDHDLQFHDGLDFDLYFALDLALECDLYLYRNRNYALAFDFEGAFDRAFEFKGSDTERPAASDSELKVKIQVLRAEIPSQDDLATFQQWWLTNGKPWAERLRAAMLKHRNIGHDWQFSEDQKETLRQYYDANQLLIDCLNSDCYVTKATRQYIEDTLLLPLSEIEKYPVPDAIANL
jgi:hypothetical protein